MAFSTVVRVTDSLVVAKFCLTPATTPVGEGPVVVVFNEFDLSYRPISGLVFTPIFLVEGRNATKHPAGHLSKIYYNYK